MTPRDEPPADPPRDAHLLAALRHAPDHALTPPSHVTQAILAAAEQVHRAPAPAVAAPAPVRTAPERHLPLGERLQALLAPRWAGSVAAGLVAALVVGLWYEEELPAPVSTEEAAVRTARETPPAVPAQPSATPAPSPAQMPAPVTPQSTAPAPAQAVRRAEVEANTAKAPRGDTAKRVTERAPVVQQAQPSAAAMVPTPNAAPAAPAVTAVSPPVPAAQAAAPRDDRVSDAAAPALRAESGVPKAADAQRAAEPATAAKSTGDDLARDGAPAAGAMRFAAGPANSASGAAAASPALTLLRRVRADTEARSAIWTWQAGAGTTARSFDADAQEWLQRLVYAARGRWVDVAERSAGSTVTELRWWRNDEQVAVLRIEAQGLRWTEPSGRIRYAPMTADELARLRLP